MRAETVIKTLLESSGGVTALVSQRIYAITRPEGDALPAAVFEIISDQPDPPFSASTGPEPCTARVQVNCLGKTPEAVKGLLEQVRLACHLKSGSIGGVSVIATLQDTSGPDGYDQLVDIYYQPIDITVHYLR